MNTHTHTGLQCTHAKVIGRKRGGGGETRFMRCLCVFNTSVVLQRAADVPGNSEKKKKVESYNIYRSRVVRVLRVNEVDWRALNQPHVISSFSHLGSAMRSRDGRGAAKPDPPPLPEISTERSPWIRRCPGNMDKSRFLCECGVIFCRFLHIATE